MQEIKDNLSKFTPDQLKQLMSLQNQMAGKRSKRQIISQKVLIRISKIIEVILFRLDRFVNFTTKKTDLDRNNVTQAARSPILFGVYVIIFCVLIGGIWASFAPLDSAAVAIGVVMSDSNRKIIQHQEGGIIANIFVNQGDKVQMGDKLIELEDTKVKSEYESNLNQYRNALATEGRLIAERDNVEEIQFSEIIEKDINIPEVAKMLHTQENLFRSKKEVYRSEKSALQQRISQLEKKIEGLEARKIASSKTFEVWQDRVKAMRTLLAKGFIQKAALLELESKEASAKGEIATIDTEIAGTHHAITEAEISIINLQNRSTEKTLTELRETQAQIATLRERYTALTDALNRIIIRSPVDGVINVLNYHTIGGVIGSGAPIMEISPINDSLIIEAKVPQKNIHAVQEGLLAKIRFSAFKSRTTPLFTGKVIKISPDIVQDKNQHPGQENSYIARIELNMEEFNKIAKAKDLELHPGMQAEVQIVTGTRTLLRYLLDPLTDTMFRAFKEK